MDSEDKKDETFDLHNAKMKVLEDKEIQLTKQDEINKEKARKEYERMENILKTIEERSKEDVGYLLNPDRYKDETFEVYKIRRKITSNFIKHRKKGTTFFESTKIEPKITEETVDGKVEKKVEIHTTTQTFVNPDRKNIKLRKENKKLR